jgi:hypothetical protein
VQRMAISFLGCNRVHQSGRRARRRRRPGSDEPD